MSDEHFSKHPALPFAECRYSKNSGRHYKSHMDKTFSVGAIDQGEVIYQSVWALVAGNVREFLQGQRAFRSVLRTAGGLMIVAGVGLALARRGS
jgi:hypothetical protein